MCYKYFPLYVSWDEARSKCKEHSPITTGDLASVTDSATNQFLRGILPANEYTWLGGFKKQIWSWVGGTAWSSWNSGVEPADGDGLETHLATNNGIWSILYKNQEFGYVCSHKGKFN